MPKSNRSRIEAVFHGELIDAVPFALKGWRVPQCTAERELRQRGMAILDAAAVHRARCPNVNTTRSITYVDGLQFDRTVVQTPKGTLSKVMAADPSAPKTETTAWHHERFFKSEADYAAIEFWIRDHVIEAAYESFLARVDKVGDDAAFKTSVPGAGIHALMIEIMGLETFCLELADNPDRVMGLIEALNELHREIYKIAARSPAEIVQSGGNYSPEVLGKARFEEFIAPHWRELCDLLHEENKLVGCHLDANNRLWAREVGESPLDWIEAFTPAPDTDMTLAEARQAWPGKTFFMNFPSSVHLAEPEVIRTTTAQLLQEAAPGERFIIGITENVPDNRWQISFPIILDTCNEYGRLPIVSA